MKLLSLKFPWNEPSDGVLFDFGEFGSHFGIGSVIAADTVLPGFVTVVAVAVVVDCISELAWLSVNNLCLAVSLFTSSVLR